MTILIKDSLNVTIFIKDSLNVTCLYIIKIKAT